MEIPWKNVLKLSQMILNLTPLAPIGAAVGAGAELIPDDDDDGPSERAWKVKKIAEWKTLARELMPIPMADERRGEVLRGKMWADWHGHYGEPPKQSWLEKMSAEVVMAVKAEIAATIPK